MWVGSNGRSSRAEPVYETPAARPMSAYGSPCGVGSSDDAPRVDDVAERGVGGLEQRRLGADRDFLDRAADFERHVELQAIGDANSTVSRTHFLKPASSTVTL